MSKVSIKGLPTQEQIDASKGIAPKKERCPKCSSKLFNFEGGDQGDLSFDFCKKCNYRKY